MKEAKNLPAATDIATLLREVIDDPGKEAICGYLLAIAGADGNIDASEEKLLEQIAENIGYAPAAA